jgi:nicotinate phosphoribosyltransferase
MVKIFDKGNCIYESPSLNDIRSYCKSEIDTLWDEVKRFEKPHRYYVDLSQPLWDMKESLLEKYSY